jgi:hypothetical protein
VPGIAELKVDVNKGKPAMSVKVDREKSRWNGYFGRSGWYSCDVHIGEKAGIYKEKAKTMT